MKQLRRFLVAVTVAITAFGAIGIGAAFADGPNDQAPVTVADGHKFVLTPLVVTIITGLLLPFLIALITKANASSLLKGLVGIVLAFVAAVLERAMLTDGSAIISGGLLVDVGAVYIPQLATYIGVWQHAGLNNKLAPNLGIG